MLEGIADHYFFEPKNIEIGKTSRTVPSLTVSDYHLCGTIRVEADPARGIEKGSRTAILKAKDGFVRRIKTNEEGEFCYEVKPGRYTVQPVISREEKQMGLALMPKEKRVLVSDAPVLDVSFA